MLTYGSHYMLSVHSSRIVGALLGTRTGSTLELTNSFAVPHVEREGDEVAVGKEHMRDMLFLHQKVNQNEDIVGWYATADGNILINEQSCLIHDFFTAQCPDPIHLIVDTSLAGNMLGVKAFNSEALTVGDRALAAAFKQIRVELVAKGPERIGLDLMIKSKSPLGGSQRLNSSMENLEESMLTLLNLLENVSDYVDDVVNGRKAPDYRLGSKIANVVSMVPRIKPEFFVKSFNSSLHDLLMVVYLSNLTRTQLAIAERIVATS